jgi:signal transduction histidine kinase
VLVIEDDPDTLANLCDILELDGYEVEGVTCAAAAVQRTDWDELLAVVLDRGLPDSREIDVLPFLQQHLPRLSVVVVTGLADVEGAIAALRQGAIDYILKPINADVLRATLRRISQVRQQRLELARQTLQQAAAAEFAQAALRSSSLPELFSMVVESAAKTLSTPLVTVWELLPDDSTLVRRAAVGWGSSPCAAESLTADPRFELGYALRQPRPVLWSANESLPFVPHPELKGCGAVCGVDLLIAGTQRAYGVMCVHHTQPRDFSQADISFLQTVAGLLATAVDRHRSEERAVQSERLAAIGQMAAGLAHESRNALQRSIACLEMLALEVEGRPQALALVERCRKAQEHVHRLYEEVRGYAAPIRLRKQPHDLSEVWRETWSHVVETHPTKQLRLVEEGDTAGCRCSVDRSALQQVFRNIFENAFDASPNESEIRLTVSRKESAGGALVRIAIRDSGPGFSPEQAARVFEPFYTTKTQGTGLGMPIARRIVEVHGGYLAVSPPTGSGGEVYFTLPCSNCS